MEGLIVSKRIFVMMWFNFPRKVGYDVVFKTNPLKAILYPTLIRGINQSFGEYIALLVATTLWQSKENNLKKKILQLYTGNISLIGLAILFFATLSLLAYLSFSDSKSPVAPVQVAQASIGTTTPTPFQPLPSTGTPIPSPTPTPIANPYDYEGANFGVVTEVELLNGIKFNPGNSQNAILAFYFLDHSIIEVEFLPIRYWEWMGDNFDNYCKPGSRKGCVYATEGHLTIGLHSGCLLIGLEDIPLEAEGLRVLLEGWKACDNATPLTNVEFQNRLEKLKSASVKLRLGDVILNNLEVAWIEHIPKGETGALNYAPSTLFSLIDSEEWSPSPPGRYLLAVISGREVGCTPWYSCDWWLIILERKT